MYINDGQGHKVWTIFVIIASFVAAELYNMEKIVFPLNLQGNKTHFIPVS